MGGSVLAVDCLKTNRMASGKYRLSGAMMPTSSHSGYWFRRDSMSEDSRVVRVTHRYDHMVCCRWRVG